MTKLKKMGWPNYFYNMTEPDDQKWPSDQKKKKFICQPPVTFYKASVFFADKMQKMTISTSVWSAQHPNTGQNIQHTLLRYHDKKTISVIFIYQPAV